MVGYYGTTMPRITKADIRRVMQVIGKKGGKAKSPKKTAAARLNATRPRPNRRKKKLAA